MDTHLDQPGFVPLTSYHEYPPEEMLERSRQFAAEMQRRRTVRQFSDRPVSRAVMLLVVGYPAPGVKVPDLQRKPLSAIAKFR